MIHATTVISVRHRGNVAMAGDGQVTLSWTAPESDGGSAIQGYVVTAYVGFVPQPTQRFDSTATTQTITGLDNGKSYRFRVQALNAVGPSGYSETTDPVTPEADATAPD